MIRRFFYALIFTGSAAFTVKGHKGNDCNCPIPDTVLRVSISWNHWDWNTSKWICEDKNTTVYDDKSREIEMWGGCDNDMKISHTIYTYGNGGLVKTTYYDNNDSEIVLNTRSVTYDYPQVDTVLTQVPSNNGWLNLNLEVITNYHNSLKGLPGEKVGYTWKNSSWVPQSDTVYQYNSFDSITSYTENRWDNNSSKFIPTIQKKYTFNSSRLLTEYLYRVAVGSSLNDSHKEMYSYDIKNRVTEKDYYDWEKSNSSWKPSGRDISTYNSGSGFELINKETQNWSGSAWVTSGKQVDSLDNEGRILANIIYQNENGQWSVTERYVFAYDCFGNNITVIEQPYTDSKWENLYQTQITYFYKFSTSSRNPIALTKNVPRIYSKKGMISIENVTNNKDVAAEIFDLRGRMVAFIKTQALQNKITINTNNILAINTPYLICIKDHVGNTVWKGKLPVIY